MSGLGQRLSRRRAGRRRTSIATQTALVTVAVALIALVITGAVSIPLVQRATRTQARATLARQATVVAGLLDTRQRTPPQTTSLLRKQGIRIARVSPQGTVTGDPLAKLALSGHQQQLDAGRRVSYAVQLNGDAVLVEARPLRNGAGIVLVERSHDSAALTRSVIGRTLLALLAGLVVAMVAGLLLARRLAKPLQRAAAAAHEMSAGRRDVRVRPSGPAEVAEVADSLNTLATALTTSEGRQREFLLSVSHELRTPLTAIRGYAEALADGVTTDGDVVPAARTMLGESRRLERLVSDLLDLARLGAQDFRVDPIPTDLTALVEQAATVWTARCSAVGVQLRAELPAQPLVVVTDPTRLRQIIDGLAENALRVTPAGRPIVLALRTEGPAVVVEVRDGGPGLTPEDCAVAFDRSVLYERYRGVRRVGTGVGLALVHGLATRLGGTARAGRAPEGGACFAVRLPSAGPVAAAPGTLADQPAR